MSLVCQPSIVPPAAATPETPIVNDGFFPDVDPAKLRLQLRMESEVTPDRLRSAAIGAIITVANDLAAWRTAQVAAGHATLVAVPSPAIDGVSRLVQLYRRAIVAFTRAELIERQREADLTSAGRANLEAATPGIDEVRRDGRHAIRDMLGRTRTTIELI